MNIGTNGTKINANATIKMRYQHGNFILSAEIGGENCSSGDIGDSGTLFYSRVMDGGITSDLLKWNWKKS